MKAFRVILQRIQNELTQSAFTDQVIHSKIWNYENYIVVAGYEGTVLGTDNKEREDVVRFNIMVIRSDLMAQSTKYSCTLTVCNNVFGQKISLVHKFKSPLWVHWNDVSPEQIQKLRDMHINGKAFIVQNGDYNQCVVSDGKSCVALTMYSRNTNGKESKYDTPYICAYVLVNNSVVRVYRKNLYAILNAIPECKQLKRLLLLVYKPQNLLTAAQKKELCAWFGKEIEPLVQPIFKHAGGIVYLCNVLGGTEHNYNGVISQRRHINFQKKEYDRRILHLIGEEVIYRRKTHKDLLLDLNYKHYPMDKGDIFVDSNANCTYFAKTKYGMVRVNPCSYDRDRLTTIANGLQKQFEAKMVSIEKLKQTDRKTFLSSIIGEQKMNATK